MEKKSRNLNKLIPYLLFICCLFMSIGYATINSITSTVSGEVSALAQEGIFITDVSYSSGDEVSQDYSYYGTLLYSSIELDTSDSSSITYQVTIYNSTSIDYVFTGTTVDSEFYSNDKITYELTGISEKETELSAYGYVTFYITFYYTDNTYSSDSSLESYIQFEFAYADSYCEVNGVTSLYQCLISNDSKTDYDTSVANIVDKGTPDYSKTAPASTYVEKTSSGTISMSSNRVYVGTDYEFSEDNGAYTITNATLMYISDIDLTDGNTYYTSNSSSYVVYTLYEIKSVNGTKLTVLTHTQSVANSSGSSGLYYTTDYDGGNTYYYRGEVDNNWVSFAGYLWRVIRINSDGSVRMIYSGVDDGSTGSNHTGSNAQITTSLGKKTATYSATSSITGNTYLNAATYVGYMYNPELSKDTTPKYSLLGVDDGGTSTLSNFPSYTGMTESAKYYFFDSDSFDLDENCSEDQELCTMTCTNFDAESGTGDNCIYTTWATLAEDSNNYTTDTENYGSTKTAYVYLGEYKYTCWGLGSTKSDGDDISVSCAIVSEILGVVPSSSYASGINNKSARVRYHGLFSESYDSAITNVSDSNAKYEVDYWYENNILGTDFEDYLVDEIFCGGRVVTSGTGYNFDGSQNTYYESYNRNVSNNSPSLECSNVSDAYTTSDALGNGSLDYPIGLITADEVALAGGVNGLINYNYYLYTGSAYWTMSPSYFDLNGLSARVLSVNSTGNLYQYYYVSYEYGIRPVINLSSDVLYVSGIGTEDDPYIVGLSS